MIPLLQRVHLVGCRGYQYLFEPRHLSKLRDRLVGELRPLSLNHCSGTLKVPLYGMSVRCTVVSAVLSGAGSRQLNRKKVSVIEMIFPLPSSSSGKIPMVSIARRPVGHPRVPCTVWYHSGVARMYLSDRTGIHGWTFACLRSYPAPVAPGDSVTYVSR
jgi:hypothetical protein